MKFWFWKWGLKYPYWHRSLLISAHKNMVNGIFLHNWKMVKKNQVFKRYGWVLEIGTGLGNIKKRSRKETATFPDFKRTAYNGIPQAAFSVQTYSYKPDLEFKYQNTCKNTQSLYFSCENLIFQRFGLHF